MTKYNGNIEQQNTLDFMSQLNRGSANICAVYISRRIKANINQVTNVYMFLPSNLQTHSHPLLHEHVILFLPWLFLY